MAIAFLSILPSTVIAQPTTAPVELPKPIIEAPVILPEPIPPSYLFNCYEYVALTYTLPRMQEIVSGASSAFGPIAVFRYSNGLNHIAMVTGQGLGEFYIRETNFKAGKLTERTVSFEDKSLLGFYTP